MFRASKPSLRHFAVLERELRTAAGSVWAVQDRRNPLRKQCLFVPTKVSSWPIWVVRLEFLEPTPTRLRNGKVALLLSSPDASLVRSTFRSSTKNSRVKLNALTGFELTQKAKRRMPPVLIPIMALACSCLWFIPRDSSVATQTEVPVVSKPKVDLCRTTVSKGSEIVGVIARYESIELAGQEFKIADIKRLGGLVQIKAKRLCDKRYFRIDSWSEGKKLRVERVY